jgi:hypothetical protein
LIPSWKIRGFFDSEFKDLGFFGLFDSEFKDSGGFGFKLLKSRGVFVPSLKIRSVCFIRPKDTRLRLLSLYLIKLCCSCSTNDLLVYQKTVHEDIQSRLFQVHNLKRRES